MTTSKTRRRRYASIIIVPPQRDQPLNFNLPAWLYYLLLAGLGAVVVMAIGGLFLTSWLGVRLRNVREIEARNVVLEEEAARVDYLERELEQLENIKLRILELAGVDVRAEIEARTLDRIGEDEAERTIPGITSAAGPVVAPSTSVTHGTLPSLWPVEGVISREFRSDGDPTSIHYGIDIAASHRAEVRAAGAGNIVFAGRDSVFGLMVVIDHGKTVLSYYGHNSELTVDEGDRVKRGAVIARVGSTGESSAPHLHFEVRKGGKPIDPRSYLVD
jgi:murein DD-endopeptidase MepM/ murein hydrolase activator NlpD